MTELIDFLVDQAVIEQENNSTRMKNHGVEFFPSIIESEPTQKKAQEWTFEEDRFLLDNIFTLGYAGVGEVLGRSANAVKIHVTRKGYPVPSKNPKWMNQISVSKLWQCDIKKITNMRLQGLLPGFFSLDYQSDYNRMYFIHRKDLFLWMTKPDHWVYFDIDKVKLSWLRDYLQKKRDTWQDKWLIAGDANEIMGYRNRCGGVLDVLAREGVIPAVRWQNWNVRESVIKKVARLKRNKPCGWKKDLFEGKDWRTC